jgi:two-component system CheB/CheR fusion protein
MTDESDQAKDQEETPPVPDTAEISPEISQPSGADQVQQKVGDPDDANQLPSLDIQPIDVERQAPALPYLVVAFGSSAGGLQAFRELLENLDPKTGMTFVLVPHLSPDHKSYLTEIIERYTRMPVLEVADGVRPEPNHIYVLLPEQRLTLREGIFRVEKRAVQDRGPMVIDQFFRSLAADQKNHAIGVILSGADSDGALGLRAIKGEGGIALVQSPDTAEQSGMPRHSIAAGSVDLILSPAEIGAELGRLAHHFTRPDVRSLEEAAPAQIDEQSFRRILQLLRTVSGIELRQYKPETIRRRVARRMILLQVETLADYHRFLQMRTDELRNLQEDLLINVTHFFRDPGFWESLRINVLPALFKDRPPDKPIRIWSAGCSTGEEAFSLAITLLEYLSQNGLDTPVQIFGTDASERSIETARTAVYPESVSTEISPERLRRYFLKVERGYQVSKRVRDICIFARQNLSNDPPFSHIDLLSCRNVMIYFNQMLQRQVLLTFHYALESGGYLLLGMSESLRDYGDIFNTIDRKHKIYEKAGLNLPVSYEPAHNSGLVHRGGFSRSSDAQIDSNIWPELELQRAADRIILTRFGPPGLIVDERLNVLQSRGQTAPFLDLSPGGVSWNLLRVLRDGIANETHSAVQRSIRENLPVTATAVFIDEARGEQSVQIDVMPISSTVRSRCFLILFQTLLEPTAGADVDQNSLPHLTIDEKDRLIAQLRQEQTSTRFHLQSLVEERDAHNQELVSANEEIQSANEELHSTNEELETTKEELQSANEELQTVNDELQQRNNVLTQTGNDLTNLLNSVNIPLLMLTNDLQIRQFTPPMQRLLNVRPADIGRSIREIRLQLSIENIEPILNDVLDTLGTREREVQDREGRWHLLRVRPYRTAENKIEGLVIVLFDIDQLRRSQEDLMDARDFATSVVEGVPVPIVVLNQDCSIRRVNTAFSDLAELPPKELEGRSLPELLQLLWGIQHLRERLDSLFASPGTRLEFEHESQTAHRKTLLITVRVLPTDGERVFLLMMQDITSRREAERRVSEQKAALESEVKVAALTLDRTKEELHGLTSHLFTVQEEEREHVARELHDDISQRLSGIEILLHEIQSDKSTQENAAKLESAKAELQSLNADVRQISHRLHPSILKDLGLSAALKSLVHEFGRRENMPATYVSRDLPESWADSAAIAIYRICQEALRNVAKHAGRTHVKVLLEGLDRTLLFKVMDFGTGFDQESEHPPEGLGLISMKERARLAGGSFEVQSALGEGTTITVKIPVN